MIYQPKNVYLKDEKRKKIIITYYTVHTICLYLSIPRYIYKEEIFDVYLYECVSCMFYQKIMCVSTYI